MQLFQWTPEYVIDLPQIDMQHQELVRLLNELYTAMKEGRAEEAIDSTLEQLLQYVDVHFETEERAMRDRRYPEYKAHVRIHKQLRQQVYELNVNMATGKGVATFQLLNFLSDWLKTHIGSVDRAFGQFVLNQDRRTMPPP